MVVPGFRFAAAAAGLKKVGGPDLALMVAEAPVAAAGVFTANRVKAAPVLVSRERLRKGRAQAVLVNSGNANACTGPGGMAAARETTRMLAGMLKVPEALVLPASTGVIGAPLPVAKIQAALPELVARLSPEGLPEVAQAILTTDTRPKLLSVQVDLAGRPVTLAGVAKGAGMIHPDLATLLSFVFTDAAVAPKILKTLLRQAAAASFNCITVDGDTSTNDTVLILASGKADNPLIAAPGAPATALGEALTRLLIGLAHMIVADAEGATRFFRVEVKGAASPAEARKAAKAVATSPLVKTAMAGADVNWGRIMAALGRSGARFHPEQVDIAYGPHPVVKNGQGLGPGAEAAAQELIKAGPFILTINLNAGDASHHYDTCDLTENYIRINASYRS